MKLPSLRSLQPCWLAVATLITMASLDAKPNVLFIAVDDLRPELGCYGSPVLTPNIDQIALKGLVFDRAYCQQAVCSPTRSSLLTGTRPDTTKVWDLNTHFRKALPNVITLPQLFKNNGYFTQAMGKIYHHGFDDAPSWSAPTAYPAAKHGAERSPADPDAQINPKTRRGPPFGSPDIPDNAMHDGELADMAVAALGKLQQQGQPFFLAVGFIKPHLPFIAPKKYWDLYDPAKIALAPNPFRPKGAPPYSVIGVGEVGSYGGVPAGPHLPDDYARKLKHGYYAAVSYMDAQVGRVLAELDRLKLRDNTIIVLWGDHGWKLGEHDAWAKHSNVENDTRVPLLISAPGMAAAGQHSSALVEFVDVYPTLAELAELPLPSHLEGRSFKPLLTDPKQPWKAAAFSQYPRKVAKQDLLGYSMRTDRYRLTRWVVKGNLAQVKAVELYDHQNDPQENTNIADDPANQNLLKQLTQQWLAGWQATQAKPAPSKPTTHTERKIEGWTVRIDDRLLSTEHSAMGTQVLKSLEQRLSDIKAVVPDGPLQKLQGFKIVLDLSHGKLRPMQYHPSADWLKNNGYAEDLGRCVHIPIAKHLIEPRQINVQPWCVLHELAHAYHDQVLGFEEPRILAAYKRYQQSGHGDAALLITGEKVRHYGLTDQKEFFSEMTEAYFGTNDFFPFNRGELMTAEPAIYQLMKEIWGPLRQ